MRYNGTKLSSGDIWLAHPHYVPVQFYDGMFRFPQGVGGAHSPRDKDGMTPAQFFAKFPEAERVITLKKIQRRVKARGKE